ESTARRLPPGEEGPESAPIGLSRPARPCGGGIQFAVEFSSCSPFANPPQQISSRPADYNDGSAIGVRLAPAFAGTAPAYACQWTGQRAFPHGRKQNFSGCPRLGTGRSPCVLYPA